MQILKAVDFKLANLSLPHHWKKKLKLGTVQAMAMALNNGAKLNHIRLEESRPNQGMHRIAAHMVAPSLVGMAESGIPAFLAGWVEKGKTPKPPLPTIRAEIVKYDDSDEKEADHLEENLNRQLLTPEERAANLKRLIEIYTKREEDKLKADAAALEAENAAAIAAGEKPKKVKGKAKGRPETPKRKAIKAAAKTAGVSESTATRAADGAPEPAPVNDGPALDWFGCPVDGDVDGKARKIKAAINEADVKLMVVRRLLTAARDAGLSNALCDDLDAAYGAFAHQVRQSCPASACPACKGSKSRKGCNDCGGVGFATKAQAESHDVPAQLRSRGAEAMVRDGSGGFRLLTPPAPAKKAPKVTAIVTEDAQEPAPSDVPDVNPDAIPESGDF